MEFLGSIMVLKLVRLFILNKRYCSAAEPEDNAYLIDYSS
jgi:hypothetical protein